MDVIRQTTRLVIIIIIILDTPRSFYHIHKVKGSMKARDRVGSSGMI